MSLTRDKIRFSAEYALSQVIEEGIFALGGQLTVLVEEDTIIDTAAGHAEGGRRLLPANLHNVYCLFKPFVYLLLGHALEMNGYQPDKPLDEIVKMPLWAPGQLTYRQLAAHEVPLTEPSAAAWMMTSPTMREDLLKHSSENACLAYSEVSGGLIAEHIIQQLTGLSPIHYCTHELLNPLGLTDQVMIDPELAVTARKRIRTPFMGLPVEPLPMLTELLLSYLREIRLAIGALATMRGMARLYQAVGNVLEGTPKPGLPSPAWLKDLIDDSRPFREDSVLGRPAKWAAGLMTDIDKQNISRAAGPGSFGHTGGLANTVALYDPSRKTAIALYLNGVGTEREDHILPRMQIIDMVINAFPSH